MRGSGAVNLHGPGTCGGRSWDPSLNPSTPRDNVLRVLLLPRRSKRLQIPSSGDKTDFSSSLVLAVPRARVPPMWDLAMFYY